MRFLRIQSNDGELHNINADLVIDFVEIDEFSTRLFLNYPMHEYTFEVPWNAGELIEEIYGLDDANDSYEVIDCTPIPPENIDLIMPGDLPNQPMIDLSGQFFLPPESDKNYGKKRRGKGGSIL